MPGKVPDRWEDYVAFKHPVKGTRFIAFKVPLEQGICQRLPEDQWFTPEKLIQDLETNQWRLGLVADLTNTKRYYKPSEIEVHGVAFIKINTEGRVVPSKAVQQKFFTIVDDFLERNVGNDLLIGVHCTHGLNRTGYMVCRYMIDKMRFNPKEAIEAFNDARGYSMERENYITDLMNSDRDVPLPVDNTSDGEIVEDEDSESGITAFPPKAVEGTVAGPKVDKSASEDRSPAPDVTDTGRGGFRGRGFRGRGFQHQGGRGFQRRPFNNRGFQNNYNRGRGFQDGNSGFRGRGDFRGRGGFRSDWKDKGGYGQGFSPYGATDLDEDTEVIITKSERGTIIREERPASASYPKERESTAHKHAPPEDEGFSYRGRGGFRPRLRERQESSTWDVDDRPPRKYKVYDGSDEERDFRGRGGRGYRGRGSFDGEWRGRGRGSFRQREESFGHSERDHTERRPGPSYQASDRENKYKSERDFTSAGTHKRNWSPEEQRFRPKESQRGRGSFDSYRGRGEGRGFSRGRGEGRGFREERTDYEGREARSFQGRGFSREFDEREEGRTPRGRGGFIVREEERGFVGRGQARDTSPDFRMSEGQQDFRQRSRGYEEEPPHFKERERPAFRDREPSAPFRAESPSPVFRKKTPGSKYSREGSTPVFGSDISDDSFEEPEVFSERGGFRGRVATKGFKAPSRDFGGDRSSPPRGRPRRATPPAQYRDREPSPPPFKRRDRTPPFREASPEPMFRDDGFKKRGIGREEYRGRGRGDSQNFRPQGAFQKTHGAYKPRADDWD